MIDAERIAELERENRMLRAMLDLQGRERSLVTRLMQGPATLADLMSVIEAERGDTVTQHAVYLPLHKMRPKLRRHGLALCQTGRRPEQWFLGEI